MILNNYEMNLPSYSIGDKVYNTIKDVCKDYGTKILVIGGKKALNAAKNKIKSAVKNTNFEIINFIEYGNECTYKNIDRLSNLEDFKKAHMVFAVGGGKALDTCKCLCIENNKPIFTFPTIASNCAACTSVSVIYKEDGSFLKPHFFTKPPIHTFIDTEIIAEAPEIYLWAGIGDTYAKYYEATISSRDEELQHFTALGVTISKMCLDPLMKYGKKAYEDNKKGIFSYEFEQTVLSIVVTTGIASILLTRDFTPDYNSGLAHAIFYALTSYPIIEEKHLHGEVVGFGVLIALLVDGQEEEFNKIYNFNKSINLPVSLKDINILKEEFNEVINVIPNMSDVKHYPYVVTREMLEKAIRRVEEM